MCNFLRTRLELAALAEVGWSFSSQNSNLAQLKGILRGSLGVVFRAMSDNPTHVISCHVMHVMTLGCRATRHKDIGSVVETDR